MSSPSPKEQDNDFSALQAFRHLQVIAQKQHAVFDLNAIEEVRNYIEETIDAFDHVKWAKVKHSPIEVKNQKSQNREMIDIHNIYAEIEGSSGVYMLLMAHYDSSPYKEKYGVGTEGSYGAADDGYGVATMLEIMRLLNESAAAGTLVNGVKFAFTDAEEVALGGAAALVSEFSSWLEDVNILINLEARGIKGPLYMFQSSKNNFKLIEFYSRTRLPFSFSIASDVYKHLPNDTDFTPFLKKGWYPGLNFSILNSLKYYHTPLDNLENADLATIQLYGEQIYPLVTEYTGNEKYSAPNAFVSNNNAVFFTLLPGFLVYYSEQVSWILLWCITLCTFFLFFVSIRKRTLSITKALLALFVWIGYLFSAAIVGWLLAMFVGFVTGNKFALMHMPHVPFDLEFVILFALLVFAAGFFIGALCKKFKCSDRDTLGGAILLMSILAITSAFLLHGGTYLFVWPALFMLATFCRHTVVRYILLPLAIIITSILYITIIYSLFLALTFGALAIILLFTALLGCALASLPSD